MSKNRQINAVLNLRQKIRLAIGSFQPNLTGAYKPNHHNFIAFSKKNTGNQPSLSLL
jgi:hypothetical protein